MVPSKRDALAAQFAPENSRNIIGRVQDAATQAQDSSSEELVPIDDGLKPIGTLLTKILPEAGAMPRDYATAKFSLAGEIAHPMGKSRDVPESLVFWEAPGLCHRPLYFEDVNLERHGYKFPVVQPAVSAAHFFGRIPLMPYMMLSEHNAECQYALGHYRPGDYAPYSLYIPKLRLGPGTVQAAVVTGVLFAFP